MPYLHGNKMWNNILRVLKTALFAIPSLALWTARCLQSHAEPVDTSFMAAVFTNGSKRATMQPVLFVAAFSHNRRSVAFIQSLLAFQILLHQSPQNRVFCIHISDFHETICQENLKIEQCWPVYRVISLDN